VATPATAGAGAVIGQDLPAGEWGFLFFATTWFLHDFGASRCLVLLNAGACHQMIPVLAVTHELARCPHTACPTMAAMAATPITAGAGVATGQDHQAGECIALISMFYSFLDCFCSNVWFCWMHLPWSLIYVPYYSGYSRHGRRWGGYRP
jgi:hypothetical protein